MKKNLLKLIFVGLLATIFTSCGSSGSSTAINVEDNATAEKAEADRLAVIAAQAEADRLAAAEALAVQAELDRLAAIAAKTEADRLAAEKAAADANKTEPEAEVPVTTGNWEILPF